MGCFVSLSLDRVGFSDLRRRINLLDPTVRTRVNALLEKADESYVNKAQGRTFVWNDIEWVVLYGVKDLAEFDVPFRDKHVAATFIDLYSRKVPERCVLYSREGNGEAAVDCGRFMPDTENVGLLPYEMTERESA